MPNAWVYKKNILVKNLNRIKRLPKDKILYHLTFRIFDFKRYVCAECGWEGLRWEDRFNPIIEWSHIPLRNANPKSNITQLFLRPNPKPSSLKSPPPQPKPILNGKVGILLHSVPIDHFHCFLE